MDEASCTGFCLLGNILWREQEEAKGGEEETEEDGRKERWGQERQEGSVVED